MFKDKVKKYQYIIIFLIFRLVLIFIKFNISEFAAAGYWFEQLKENNIPIYVTNREFWAGRLHPPLFYYVAYIQYYLGGTYLVMKLSWLIFDALSAFYVYKIGNLIFNFKKEKRDLFICLYLLCPFVFLLTALTGLGEIISLFFVLSSFYYFIKEKYIFSFVFLSLGALYEFFPIFLIIPYFLFLLNDKKKLLRVIPLFIAIFFILFILITLPYFIAFGWDYFKDLLSIVSRGDYSIGLHEVLPDWSIINLKVINFDIVITLYNIIQAIIIFTSLILFSLKFKVNTNEKLITCICYFFLLVPILSRSFHFRLLLWVIPFLLLYLLIHQSSSREEKEFKQINSNLYFQIITFTIGNIIILALFLYYLSKDPNFGFPRTPFYLILIIYCIFWGFCLLFLNLMKLMILEVYVLFFCFYLFFFIYFGYYGLYNLVFFPIYCILFIFTITYFLKTWNGKKINSEILVK